MHGGHDEHLEHDLRRALSVLIAIGIAMYLAGTKNISTMILDFSKHDVLHAISAAHTTFKASTLKVPSMMCGSILQRHVMDPAGQYFGTRSCVLTARSDVLERRIVDSAGQSFETWSVAWIKAYTSENRDTFDTRIGYLREVTFALFGLGDKILRKDTS